MKNKTKKRVTSILITLALMICLIACGNSTPAIGNDVVSTDESRESTEESTESSSVESSTEESKEASTEIVESSSAGSEVAGASGEEKPAVTASPEPSATPNPTSEPTSTPSPSPEPTPEPHVHEYTETIIKVPTCAEPGEKQLVCQGCGDSKTEAIPATGEHNWESIYQTVTHPSTGHVEEVQVQVGTTKRTEYECKYCGHREDSPDALKAHRDSFVPTGNIDHVFAGTIAWDYEDPVYEMQSQWVVDTPETTTQELVGYKCSVCGTTK